MFLMVDRRGINSAQILGWDDDGETLTLHMTNPAPRAAFVFANESRTVLLAYLRNAGESIEQWYAERERVKAEVESWSVEPVS